MATNTVKDPLFSIGIESLLELKAVGWSQVWQVQSLRENGGKDRLSCELGQNELQVTTEFSSQMLLNAWMFDDTEIFGKKQFKSHHWFQALKAVFTGCFQKGHGDAKLNAHLWLILSTVGLKVTLGTALDDGRDFCWNSSRDTMRYAVPPGSRNSTCFTSADPKSSPLLKEESRSWWNQHGAVLHWTLHTILQWQTWCHPLHPNILMLTSKPSTYHCHQRTVCKQVNVDGKHPSRITSQ